MNPAQIPAFISERFIFVSEVNGKRRKLFQLIFRRSDGSLFINFPYYKYSVGLLSLLSMKAHDSYPKDVSLLEQGKVTGHRVKYSHHPDGNCHFSQDGKILSKIRKRSVAFGDLEGHMFTIQLQGLDDFTATKTSEDLPTLGKAKTILNWKFNDQKPHALKFVGHWHSLQEFQSRVVSIGKSPWITLERPDGSTVHGVIVSSPNSHYGREYCLVVSCEVIEALDKSRESGLTFVGGFDRREIVFDHGQDTTFLALAYPASKGYGELVNQIGSVDFLSPGSPI